jgi:sulfatase modifying factor 1
VTHRQSPQPPSLEQFLEVLHRRGIVRLGPAEHIQVSALLRIRRQAGRSELRAGLASLLATSHEQWQQIVHLFDLYFPPPDTAIGNQSLAADLPSSEDTAFAAVAGRSETHDRRRLSSGARLARALVGVRNVPRWLLVASLGLVFVTGVVLLVAFLRVPLDQLPVPDPTPLPPAPVPQWRRHPEPLIPAENKEREIYRPTRDLGGVDGLALVILFVLVLIGLRWLRLPDWVRHLRAAHRQQSQERARAERQRLGEQAERAQAPLHLSYQVERHPPLPDEAAGDSATVLGRYFRAVAGDDLDVRATVQVSIATGGRFVPVYAPKETPQALTVLVDRERGDYPWLGLVEWLLERWGALGIRFARFDYRSDPAFLTEQESGRVVSLAQLARHADGEPLLMIGRRLNVEGLDGRASWVAELEAWPSKAWLDPDPRLLSERPSERRTVRALEQLGLRRFPFTHAGLLALARYLMEDTVGIQPPPWEPLKRITDPEVDKALARWAALAALVPDATWDQLEVLRRHFLELSAALPSPWYLQRLLEWVARRNKEQGIVEFDPESADGRTLALSEALVEQLIQVQRRRETGTPAEQRLEVQARRLLLAQLDATRPEDELMRQFWEVKRISHWLCLDPEWALELMGPFMGSAAEPELPRAVGLELDRQQHMAHFDQGVRDGLAVVAGKAENRVRPSELFASPWWAWTMPVIAGGAVTVGIAIAFLAIDEWRDWLLRPDKGAPVSLILPAIWEIEPTETEFQDTLPDRSKGPVMVRIPGGCFVMGSPDTEAGRESDERPHKVCVEEFSIGKYEVTVRQFRWFVQTSGHATGGEGCLVIGADGPVKLDKNANWEAPGFSQTLGHPVVCVSLNDARAYAEWLSKQTDKSYRLPTEAEWEYAARAGSTGARYWGDDPRQACRYGNVGDETAKRRYRGWVVHGCDDGHLYTAPAGQFAGNSYGLHDMLGNVWEWTCSMYSRHYNGLEIRCSDVGLGDGLWVIRGGSWFNASNNVRAAYRNWGDPGNRNYNLGFRLARD